MNRRVVGEKRKLLRGHPDDGNFRVRHKLECGHSVPAHPTDSRKFRWCKLCDQGEIRGEVEGG